MTELQRSGYRQRLNVDQVVYFAEGENAYCPEEGEPVTKKATIREDCSERRYAVIQRWDDIDEEPPRIGLQTTMSPRSLFTETEVGRVINQRPEVAHLATVTLSDIIREPLTSRELAIALGGAEIARLSDDLIRNPDDPEY